MGERIQKVLARAGVGSRRQIEAWIREGRIAVNGAPAIVGTALQPRDRVTLDGRPLRVREPDSDTRVILYHRSPRRAPEEGQPEEAVDLSERLPKRAGRRWISISPLPPNDGGLEVLTSDGELAQALMRKLSTLRIAFALRVRGEPTLGQLEHLKSGALDEGALEVESVIPAGGEGFNRWIRLVTRGARARDVHRLCTAAGLQISRILRVSIGPLTMARDLARERTQALPLRETEELYALAGLVMKREQPAAVQRSRPSASGRRPALPRRTADSARGRAGGDRGSKVPARDPKPVRQSGTRAGARSPSSERTHATDRRKSAPANRTTARMGDRKGAMRTHGKKATTRRAPAQGRAPTRRR